MFSNVKTKTNSSFAVEVTERSNHSFLMSTWWIMFFRHLYDNRIKDFNWLCKHMKNVRSRQPCISMIFCAESGTSMWVSLSRLERHIFMMSGKCALVKVFKYFLDCSWWHFFVFSFEKTIFYFSCRFLLLASSCRHNSICRGGLETMDNIAEHVGDV